MRAGQVKESIKKGHEAINTTGFWGMFFCIS